MRGIRTSRLSGATTALVVIALLAVGCGGGASKSPSAGGTIKIGFIAPVTGEYGAYGQDSLDAVKLAVAEWNAKGGLLGQQIELVVGDSQGDGAQAAAIANQFVDQGLKAVVGPLFTLEAGTAMPVFVPAKIVAVTGLADLLDPAGTPGYFRTSPREDVSSRFASKLIREYLHASKIAIIDDGKPDTVTTAQHLSQFLTEAGVAPVFEGSVTPGQSNYTATLTQINDLAPDAVFLATVNPESGILRKQAEELGMTAKFVVASGSTDALFAEIAGAKGVPSWSYDPTTVADRYAKFATDYKAKTGREPANLNEYSYDAANVLFQAAANAGSLDFDKLTAALKALKDYPGLTGVVTFDATGSRGSEEYAAKEFKPDLTWTVIDVGFTTP